MQNTVNRKECKRRRKKKKRDLERIECHNPGPKTTQTADRTVGHRLVPYQAASLLSVILAKIRKTRY